MVIIVGVVIISLTWCFTYYHLNMLYDEVVKSIHYANSQLSISFQSHVSRIFQQADDFTLYVKNEFEKSSADINRLDAYFNVIASHSYVSQATIADQYGRVILYLNPSAKDIDMTQTPQFLAQKNATSNMLYIGNTRIPLFGDRKIIPISRRLNHPDGSFAGIVSISLNVFEIAKFFDDMFLNPQQGLNLIGYDGVSRVARFGDKHFFGTDMSQGPIFDQIKEQGGIGTYESNTVVLGNERFVSFRKLDNYPFIAVTTIDKNAALHDYYRQRNTLFLISITVSLLFGIATFFAYRILKSLGDSEQRYREIMTQSVQGIAIVDRKTLLLIEANPHFTEITGFTHSEVSLISLFSEHEDEIESLLSLLRCNMALPTVIRTVITKSGLTREVERSLSPIRLKGQDVYLLSLHDITEERKLERKASNELHLAGLLQHQLLPRDVESVNFDVRTVYSPIQGVSGDHFNFVVLENNRLNGYLIDASGHGLSTALETSAIRVIVDEYFNSCKEITYELIYKINQRLADILTEDKFVAFLGFSFDFINGELTLAVCGINHIIASSTAWQGVRKIPGVYLGISNEPDFSIITTPIKPGENFYFATDGITDLLTADEMPHLSQFTETCNFLTDLACRKERWDDCTGIFVTIKNPNRAMLQWDIYNQDDLINKRQEIRRILNLYASGNAGKLEVATQEAVNNGIRSGGHVNVKIRVFGKRIFIRVKDAGTGFPGNERLAYLSSLSEDEIIEATLFNESSRGIIIMTQVADRIFYNKQGNEVLMMAKRRSL